MNRCAKINLKAEANGMVIGDDLYKVTNSFSPFESEYEFEEVCRFTFGETKNIQFTQYETSRKRLF